MELNIIKISKILNSSSFSNELNKPIPLNPGQGQTWLSGEGCLYIWVGDEWRLTAKIYDIIDKIGWQKSNELLNQLFTDKKIRKKSPAVMNAWEHYQTLLALAYSEKNNEN